jgi:hypothetical protein
MTLNFNNLKNFVCDYLLKTEPNQVWSKDSTYKDITKTVNESKEEIIFNNKIKDKKIYNAKLRINDFDIQIINSNLNSNLLTKLAEGEYCMTNNQVKRTIEELHKYITDNVITETQTNWDTDKVEDMEIFKYGDFCVEYLVYTDKEGKNYSSIPLYLSDRGRSDDVYYNPKIKGYFDILIKFFAEKHKNFLNIEEEDQRNYIYIYRFTSPYTLKSKSSLSVGMQTVSAHMDQCNLGDDNLIAEKYCEISSIVYTGVKNKCSMPENYYASAAFFYGPEIPMPINGEIDLQFQQENKISDKFHKHLLYNFQHNYKRLFVSAPMKTSGWAIWLNKPKRTIKNTNPVDPSQFSTTVYKPWSKDNLYTHITKNDNEFVYHASPFVAPDTKNWAPTSVQGCDIQRANITVRRANYNIFRMIRDLFDSNGLINLNAKNMIQALIRITRIYKEPFLKNIEQEGVLHDLSNDNLKNISEYLEFINENMDNKYYNIVAQIYKKFINGKILNIVDSKKCEDFNKFTEVERYSFDNGLLLLESYLKSALTKYIILYQNVLFC